LSGISGVANTGTDRNWTGHLFEQANWYCFGRMAWNCEISAKEIAQKWAKKEGLQKCHGKGSHSDICMVKK